MRDRTQDRLFEERISTLLGEEHEVSPGLERRILQSLPTADALQRLFDWVASSLLRAAAAAALPLVLGFAAGFGQQDEINSFDDEVLTLVFAEPFEEFNDE